MGEGDGDEHFNMVIKNHMGWVEPNEVADIVESGTYRLYTHDQKVRSGNTIGMRLLSGNGTYIYWLEFRTLKNTTAADLSFNGIQVHLQNYFPNIPGREWFRDDYTDVVSYLLDMTPNSKKDDTWHANDATDSELLVGKSFTDKYGAFTIKPIRVSDNVDDENAWIDVQVTMH
jgi:hypothetical protein